MTEGLQALALGLGFAAEQIGGMAQGGTTSLRALEHLRPRADKPLVHATLAWVPLVGVRLITRHKELLRVTVQP